MSTGTYVPPTIAVTSPATVMDASSRTATISWSGTDSNIDPHIALYYDQIGSGFAGTRIVEGLVQDAGTHRGSYRWDMSALPAGAYHVYGVIYDDRGSARAYAPGVLVVPNTPQAGQIKVNAQSNIRLNETLGVSTFTIALNRRPMASVLVPLNSSDTTEATVKPQQVTFTPDNWWVPQIATISSVKDNIGDGDQPFEITVGRAISTDPEFIGLSGNTVSGVTVDNGIHTSVDGLSITGYQRVSKQYNRLLKRWTYRYRVVISNQGPKVNTVSATVASAPGYTVLLGTLLFGAIGQDESATSVGQIVLVSKTDMGDGNPNLTWTLKAL